MNISERKKIKPTDVMSEKTLEQYFDRLYPICRSILGKGFRDSLEIISELIPFEYSDIETGTEVLDWLVPNEWSCIDAYIIKPDGTKIAQFLERNLHLVQYSIPIEIDLTLDELKSHIHTLPDMPEHFPYVTSYYKEQWGFCISQNELDSLKPGNYKVVIKSDLKPGKLRYGQTLLKGKTDREILLSGYLCHPQMANHELSGVLTMAVLYHMLQKTAPHKFTYRFAMVPENIGAAALLHEHGDHLLKKVDAGYIMNCLGHGKNWTYKRSRRHKSKADYAAINYLKHRNEPLEIVDFFPDGSDERQYCSPGFNLPIGLIMRQMYGRFPEYHTSADDKSLISFSEILESAEAYYNTLMTLELDCIPKGRVQHGSPMLSRSTIPLYRDTMNFRANAKGERTRVMLEILNLAEGKLSLLEIAEMKNFQLLEMSELVEDLIKAGYIEV